MRGRIARGKIGRRKKSLPFPTVLFATVPWPLADDKRRLPVRATTRTGYMMTSPKFSTWFQNQGTRSRVTFQLFATPRNDLFPQFFRGCAFEWRGSPWVWKKWQPMKFYLFSRGKTAKNGSVSAQRSTRQGAKHRKIEGVFQFFDLWKNYFWNIHKICLLVVVFLSWCKAFSHSAVRLNLQ